MGKIKYHSSLLVLEGDIKYFNVRYHTDSFSILTPSKHRFFHSTKISILRLNMFTAPAYFMSCIILITIIAMLKFFQDRVRIATTKDSKKSSKREAINDHANQMTFVGLTIYDCCILGCMLLNVSTKGSISSFETLGISFGMTNFGMEASRAATIVATCGSMGVIALLSMGHLAKFLSDIQLICFGMIVMASGIISLTFVDEDGINSSWRFVFAIFMIYSVGYPIGHTAVIGLFSKSTSICICLIYLNQIDEYINMKSHTCCCVSFLTPVVGRRPQGTLLGWFASAGSLARMTFPIMSGYVADYAGITLLFYILAGVLTVSTAFTLYSKSTLEFLSQ